MRDAELEELAHQRVGKRNRARAGIDLRRLREVPVLHELDQVVKICDDPLSVSPVRGSCTLGPTEFSTVDGSQRTIVWRMSSGDQSGSSAGTSPGTIPSLKPAASNAGCQSRIARRIHGFH